MTTFGLAAPGDLWSATGLQGNARPRLADARPRLAAARSSVCATPAPHGEDKGDLRYRIFLQDLTTSQAMANSSVLSMAAGVQKNGATCLTTSCSCAAREGGLYGRVAFDLTTARARKASSTVASSVLSPVADVQGVSSSYPHLPAASSMHPGSRSKSCTLCCVEKRPSSSVTPQHSNLCSMAVNISRRLAKELARLTNIFMKFIERMMKRQEMEKLNSILILAIFDASSAVLYATRPPSATAQSPEVKKSPTMWSTLMESARKWVRKLAMKAQSMAAFKMLAELVKRVMKAAFMNIICVFVICFIYIATKKREITCHIVVQLLLTCKMVVVECCNAVEIYNLPEKSMNSYKFMLEKGRWLMVECKKFEKAYKLSEKGKMMYAKAKAYNFTEKVEEAGSLAEKTSIALGKMEKVCIIFRKLVKYFF